MKVLWLSTIDFSEQAKGGGAYYGGGWISSLKQEMEKTCNIKLGIAYLTMHASSSICKGNTTFFPIKRAKTSSFSKILRYYNIDRLFSNSKIEYLDELSDVIQMFKPDIIHLFGIENPFAAFLKETTIPSIVHLQGLMQPINNAFFPPGMNKYSILFPFSIREWLFRNGYNYAKRTIENKASKEEEILSHLQHVMGRTRWDYDVTHLLAPHTKYYHVDEILRECFYKNAGKWKWYDNHPFCIISTISDTIYKGLDLILKTAKVLKDKAQLSFEWKIVGIGQHSRMASLMERFTRIKSENVNVVYLGILNEQSLCEELLKSSIYVHTSYIDNSPNSLCEAQILGLPVIGTYVGGIPSLIEDNETGLLVPANSPYHLAAAIVKLSKSSDLCKQLSSSASQSAIKRHDVKDIINDIMETYRLVSNG